MCIVLVSSPTMASKSETCFLWLADRIGSSVAIVHDDPAPVGATGGLAGGALGDPDMDDRERSGAIVRGGVCRFLRISDPIFSGSFLMGATRGGDPCGIRAAKRTPDYANQSRVRLIVPKKDLI